MAQDVKAALCKKSDRLGTLYGIYELQRQQAKEGAEVSIFPPVSYSCY